MKKLRILLVSITAICIGLVLIQEKRSFYYNSDKTRCITVWKRFGGRCIVVPRKYIGLGKPNGEYLETTNLNSLTFIWEKYGKYDLIVFNSYGFEVNLNFKNTKVKYFGSNERELFIRTYYFNNKVKPEFEYLMADIAENWGIVNGKMM